MKKFSRILTLCLAVLMTVSLSSCANSSDKLTSENYAPGEVMWESDMMDSAEGYLENPSSNGFVDSDYKPIKGDAGTGTSSTSSNDLGNRKIIKKANLTYETKTYDEFIASLPVCLSSFGGYVESSESSGGSYSYNSRRSASFTLRIPADRYEAFMTAVGEGGTLTYKSEDSTDVTASYVDIESRISALRKEYDVLVGILEKCKELSDVIQIQSRITEVTYQIESFESQIRTYDSLISYCTVYVRVQEVERESQNVEVMSFGEKVTHGLSETFYDITTDLSEFALWFIVSLPYLLIWGVIIAAAIMILRVSHKKYKTKKEKKRIEQICRSIDENKTDNGNNA